MNRVEPSVTNSAFDSHIVIKGARVHNLKNISLSIPRDKLVVITGPSGSGKSSLAFDTIYSEGQRRYIESLSSYARQFLVQNSKPDIDLIEGLSPTLSIEQKTTSYNPRSTVGTVTEIYDYLRLLYARIGKPFCYQCKKPIRSQSTGQIVEQILNFKDGTKISLLAPIVRGRKGEYQKELLQLRSKGFVRVRVDGKILDLSEDIHLDKNKKHNIDVYIDRIIIKGDRTVLSTRLSESVELGTKMGEGLLILEIYEESSIKEVLFSEKFACPDCGISYPTAEPRTFSFNSPMGACKKCDGIGFEKNLNLDVPDPYEGKEDKSIQNELLLIQEAFNDEGKTCSECNGARLNIESLHYFIEEKNISQLCSLSVSSLSIFFKQLSLTQREQKISDRILKEISSRLYYLNDVGLEYLQISRSAQSLSGGESQRIRLATQIGSSLVGVIYVLDEPSIGLHQRDNEKLIKTLIRLRDLGNTVLVVEHDQDTMKAADWIVDLGPGAGTEGGYLISNGTFESIIKNKKSITGQYLIGEKKIAIPKVRRPWSKEKTIHIVGAYENNLKNINVHFPIGILTVVTGVSGSGKSTLVFDTLYRALAKHVYRLKINDPKVKEITGYKFLDKVIDIDQSPIGKTPRSNPATYVGVFASIRDLFAMLPESQVRGYTAGRFSFNVKGGRCDYCEGGGQTKVEMHFLPDVYVQCEKCSGLRYHSETLQIQYRGKNIAEVLQMTCLEALSFFDSVPLIKNKLKVLNDVGLGYVQLGQSSTTLSGGEAQRIKLAKELSKRATGKTLYILDEPSTGLHFDDVKKLIAILQELVDQGNTVVVIEHNLDIIKVADHIIDIGPEGGSKGGEVIGAGTPEFISLLKNSETGRFLKKYLSS